MLTDFCLVDGSSTIFVGILVSSVVYYLVRGRKSIVGRLSWL
jgi:hypothetical protein